MPKVVYTPEADAQLVALYLHMILGIFYGGQNLETAFDE